MRIVSLVPSLSELVCYLGAGRCLVGRTRFCEEPREELELVESLGGTKDPDLERLMDLSPDLILMNEEENRREDHEVLTGAGLRCETFLPRTVDDVPEMIRRVGALLERSPEAETLGSAIEQRAERVRSRGRGRGKRFAYMIWRKPWMSAGTSTYISSLFEAAGAVNAISSEGYPEISVGSLARARPDSVLLSSEPYPFREPHREELAIGAGIDASRIHLVDGRILSWHGSSTLEALGLVEAILGCVRS